MDIWLCTTFLRLCAQWTYDCVQHSSCYVHNGHMTAQHSWGYVYNEHMTVYNIPGVMCTMDTHNPRNVVHSHMCIVYITPGMLYTVICPFNIPGVMYTMHIWLCTTLLGLCIQWTYGCVQHSWGYVYNGHMTAYVHCTHNPRNVVHSRMSIVYITPGMLYTVICSLYT
jgi:hypothetical protein